jgi:hypothetical protein
VLRNQYVLYAIAYEDDSDIGAQNECEKQPKSSPCLVERRFLPHIRVRIDGWIICHDGTIVFLVA